MKNKQKLFEPIFLLLRPHQFLYQIYVGLTDNEEYKFGIFINLSL